MFSFRAGPGRSRGRAGACRHAVAVEAIEYLSLAQPHNGRERAVFAHGPRDGMVASASPTKAEA